MKSQRAQEAQITRWWWVRHAPVVGDGGRIYGQADLDCDCSDTALFSALAEMLPKDPVWLTSNLVRTHQTAEAIRRQLEGEFVPSIIIDNFAEQFLGDWQGQPREAFFAARRPQAASYWFGPADERAPGGESFGDLCERVEPAIMKLNDEHCGRDIVCVAHGGTIRAALRLALGVEAQTALAFAIRNCSVTRIDHVTLADEAGWRVAFVNHYPQA
jgi:alpha-ribazole phosphatase